MSLNIVIVIHIYSFSGSAADINEVKSKDEVLAINNLSTAAMGSSQVQTLVEEAVRTGHIELRVKRFLGAGGEI